MRRAPDVMLANPLSCLIGEGQRMQLGQLRRREFITLIGSAAAWPLAARAQQPGQVVGMLVSEPGLISAKRMAAFHQGLRETGHIEGQNFSINSLAADGRLDRLPSLAAEFVERRVNVLVCPQSSAAAIAARNATKAIP